MKSIPPLFSEAAFSYFREFDIISKEEINELALTDEDRGDALTRLIKELFSTQGWPIRYLVLNKPIRSEYKVQLLQCIITFEDESSMDDVFVIAVYNETCLKSFYLTTPAAGDHQVFALYNTYNKIVISLT